MPPFSLKLIKFQKTLVICTLISFPFFYASTIPFRIRLLQKKLPEELQDSDETFRKDSFPLDETENSVIEHALNDLLCLQNKLFKQRSLKKSDTLKQILLEMKQKISLLESVLYHENQYERMNRLKAFTVIRNALQCGSNKSLYIPKWESKEVQQELDELLQDIHFKGLCILREMVIVPKYAETLINKGLLAPIFDALYKQTYDNRTRSLASDIIFEWSKHPSTHSSFLRWNDLITEMAKKGDPLCHYTVACLLGRVMGNKDLKDITRTYVDLIDSCWIIFKSAKDTFISSIAHKAFLVSSDNTTVDFSERENRIKVTDQIGMLFLIVAPIFAYSTTRHCIRYFGDRFLLSRGREITRSRMTFYDVADFTIASTVYGIGFAGAILALKQYIHSERLNSSSAMILGHKLSVWLTVSTLTFFALIGIYLYIRNYAIIVLMPFLYPITILEVFPDRKKYVSRIRKLPHDYLRKKPIEEL